MYEFAIVMKQENGWRFQIYEESYYVTEKYMVLACSIT